MSGWDDVLKEEARERRMASRNGSQLDIKFILKNGKEITLHGVGIKVFDALRQSCRDVYDDYDDEEPRHNHFDKRFIWGNKEGVAVEDISGWHVQKQYD